MYKKIYSSLAMLLILGCGSNLSYRAPEKSSLQVLAKETFTLAHLRMNEFHDDIKISIAKISVNYEGITLLIEISNETDKDIIIKKPRSTGFSSNNKSAFNDVKLFLVDEYDTSIDTQPTSQFVLKPEMTDKIEAFLLHEFSDFILLEPHGVYHYEYTHELPLVSVSPEFSYNSLKPGTYGIHCVYVNEYIGYYDNVESLDYGRLLDNDMYIYDLNAWVGKIESTTLFFNYK